MGLATVNSMTKIFSLGFEYYHDDTLIKVEFSTVRQCLFYSFEIFSYFSQSVMTGFPMGLAPAN